MNKQFKDIKLEDLKIEPKKIYPIKKYDINGNLIYYENSTGYWEKKEYDSKGNQIYYENSKGKYSKVENGQIIEYKDDKYYINGIEAELIGVDYK